jgi:tape measure domain-containing protein
MVLNDQVTGVLKNITRALDITLHSFEQMQDASANAVDVRLLNQARAGLGEVNLAVREMEGNYRRAAQQEQQVTRNIRQSTQAEQQLNASIRGGNDALDDMVGKAKNLAATIGASVGLKKLIELSDQMTSTTARLNFIVDDGGSVKALEAKIMASAQRSRAAYLDTASAIASMGANAGAAFTSNDELIAFMEQVNKQFVIGGASAQGQAAAMLQLTQAMAAGALRGEELNSILENAPGIARAIEQYMGIAEGSIKQYAQEGQVTAEVVKNALFSVADETNAKFESMPMTWAQIWTNMQNRALQTLDPVLNKLNKLANSEQFSTVVDGALNALATITALASGILDVFVNIGSAVVDNWSVIEPIAWGLVAALVAYNAVALITQAINGAVALSAAVKGAADMFAAGKTFAATVAQQGLNAALLACPITWIVVGVIALVAGIIALCNWIAKTTGVAATGFGVITGGINVAIQAVWNAMLVVANVAIGIWNALGACCSNIGTAFHNVISNVQGWFYGLLSTALTVVEGICAALNKLPFVEFDYSGISAKADEYAAKSAEAYGSVEEYQNIGDAFTKGYNTFDTFTDGWASDAFKAGASWGDGVADKVSSFFDFGGGGTGGMDLGSGFDLSSIADNTGLTADNTGKTADALAVTEEQLEYLRDIAERDAINRFTTAEVKIDMTGMTNRIDGSADLDGVISQLTEGFTEALVTAAEGVHA